MPQANRREFFKQAGALAAAPLSKVSFPSQRGTVTSDSEVRHRSEAARDVVIENAEMRLVLGGDGQARSLLHKPTGQECLVQGTGVPMFTVTQYRPYDNELQLSYPAKAISFPARSARREGQNLIVDFALVDFEATIELKITDAYIAFTLQKLEFVGKPTLRPRSRTPIDETLFIQLPLRPRKNFGEWLNVMWDEQVAVNVLATDPYARIDAKPGPNYYLLQAATVDEIKTEGVGAALITTATENLLDRVARVEAEFDLPRGVESRRRKEYRFSYYEMLNVQPENIDRHISYARRAGFRTMEVYYASFAKTAGHFPWRPEYPRGMEDLKALVMKIRDAGMIPGIHIHYNKAHKDDAYVTPKPDPRLNLRRTFTLAEPLNSASTTIHIEENPRGCTLDDERRFLRIGNELITYENYTTTSPYNFTGCWRGALNTQPASYEPGERVGLLDVDTWPIFVRFTQNTSIQEEVAQRLGKIYREAGFEFVYYDGAEDVPPPFWFTVSRAQWLVYQHLDPKPLWGEGACKSHFSWHLLSRGNAFDVFKPEVMKEAIRAFPAAEAARVANDFTSINFGWIGYRAPCRETIGVQPDMLEYITSRAAAWDCPVSLVGALDQLEAHPRTPDNLEVLKRWEDVRASGWLSQAQKEALRNLEQEHILLLNERNDFELVSYQQIENAAGGNPAVRAFIFERTGKVCAVYWHTSGEGTLDVRLNPQRIKLMRQLGKTIPVNSTRSGVRLPLGNRLYVECSGLSRRDAITAFEQAGVSS